MNGIHEVVSSILITSTIRLAGEALKGASPASLMAGPFHSPRVEWCNLYGKGLTLSEGRS